MNKIKELRSKAYKLCEETNTKTSGIDFLINYYINNRGWSEEDALNHTIGLFKDGIITQIKLFGKGGKEL